MPLDSRQLEAKRVCPLQPSVPTTCCAWLATHWPSQLFLTDTCALPTTTVSNLLLFIYFAQTTLYEKHSSQRENKLSALPINHEDWKLGIRKGRERDL
jgi:hypothetical protein